MVRPGLIRFSVGRATAGRGRWPGRRSRRVRGAPAAALSTAGCAEHLRLRPHRTPRRWRRPPVQEAPRGGLQALADDAASPATPTPRSVRAVCTRVRGSCRGFGAQDGVATPVQWGKTPSRGANPRPEGHDGHLSEEASPVSWAHSWAHTGDAPPPHSRTRGGVADVRQGCGRSPGARRQPRGTSTPLRHVHNETSPSRRFGDLSEPRPPADEERDRAPTHPGRGSICSREWTRTTNRPINSRMLCH